MLTLRPVQERDCELLFEWANDPLVRQNSIHPEAIAWERHVPWFHAKLGDADCYHWIAEDGSQNPVGQIRFDICGGEAEIGISVARAQRGRGYAVPLIAQGVQAFFCATHSHVVHAWIRLQNTPSQHAFCAAGFVNQGVYMKAEMPLLHFVRQRAPIPHEPVREEETLL